MKKIFGDLNTDRVGAHAGKVGVRRLFARGPHAQEMVSAALAAGVAQAAVAEEHETMADLICEAATPGDVVLVKGSRAMEMENVVSGLVARLGGGAKKGLTQAKRGTSVDGSVPFLADP